MTSGLFKPEAETSGSPALRLEIVDQETKTPHLIPVLIRHLSTGGVTLAVTNPWGIPDWDHYRGADCLLRVEGPGGGEPLNIKAKIAWTTFGDPGQAPLSLRLQLIKPPGEAIGRLSNFLPHTSQDIKGLWERYDQVREEPEKPDLVHLCYMGGLVLLLGGLALQSSGAPVYQAYGWVLWLLGSLGIAGKIIRPFRQKQPAGDRFGRSL
jgi:hypothetical protein